MPQNKNLTAAVRARMAQTGENYTTARREVVRLAEQDAPALSIDTTDGMMRPVASPAPNGTATPMTPEFASALRRIESLEQVATIGEWRTVTPVPARAVADGTTSDERAVLWELSRWPVVVDAVLGLLVRPALPVGTLLASLWRKGLVEQAEPRLALHDAVRPPRLHAITQAGREVLVAHLRALDEQVPLRLLAARRPPPQHRAPLLQTLAEQVIVGSLARCGGTSAKVDWQVAPRRPRGFHISDARRGATQILARDLVRGGEVVVGHASDARAHVLPDLLVRLQAPLDGEPRSVHLMLEVDRRSNARPARDSLIAYDHFLAGWFMRTSGLGDTSHSRPFVVVVGRDPSHARALLRVADNAMTVGVGMPDTDALAYRYHGRAHIAFTCVDWLTSGRPYAWRLPAAPPGVRAIDVGVGELTELLPRAWWPPAQTSA